MPQLRSLCAAEPLNEPAHARLMGALALAGEQAAALHIFAGLRRRLDDELGISPSPLLAEAHAQVLRQQVPLSY
jgi:DNA-binding SARP family transcriptional activator